MQAGAITAYIDVPQMAFWAFFLVFLGLVFYLRREDKREGYPLQNPGGPALDGFPDAPDPLTYIRLDGTLTAAPHDDPPPPMRARPLFRFPGAPLTPIGNKLTAAVGPGTYTMRKDEPFPYIDGTPQVQPLRAAIGWSVMEGESDPRGMRVLDVRFRPVGTVREVWVDRGAKLLRFLEVELDETEGGGIVLVPIYHTDIDERGREMRVTSLRRGQFGDIPRIRHPDQVTAREEDQITGYFAGGRFHIDDFTGDDS